VIIGINIFWMILVPIYVSIPGTLTHNYEFYVLAAVYALQIGSIQSFSRVMMSRLTPPGHEAEFFSFFEITDEGTSWLGPLILGAALDATGSIRSAVLTVLIFLVLGLISLFFVKEEKGIQDCKDFAQKEAVVRRMTGADMGGLEDYDGASEDDDELMEEGVALPGSVKKDGKS